MCGSDDWLLTLRRRVVVVSPGIIPSPSSASAAHEEESCHPLHDTRPCPGLVFISRFHLLAQAAQSPHNLHQHFFIHPSANFSARAVIVFRIGTGDSLFANDFPIVDLSAPGRNTAEC